MTAGGVARQLDDLYRERDARGLARVLFKRSLWPGQAQIAGLTAFLEHPRAAVCCYTQYGKTYGMGTGLAIDLVMDPLAPRKIAMVGPRAEQAKLIRKEFLAAATSSPLGVRELGLTRKGVERLKSKSINHFVTRHGKEVKVLTTGKTGDAGEALMGHGVDNTSAAPRPDLPLVDDEPAGEAGVVVVTEAGLIPEPAWPKIRRMLGDRGILIAEGNPWRKGTGFHALWEAPSTFQIHIDVEQGIREGRIRRERVEEERATIPPLFFTVLYDSLFPDAAEGQLISHADIQRATQPQPPLPLPVERRWAIDVAEGGADLTVLGCVDVARVYGKENYRTGLIVSTTEADPLRIADWAATHIEENAIIIVDAIGPGSGVASALRRNEKKPRVRSFKAGELALDPESYRNMGSEGYWRLRVAHQEDRITIPQHRTLMDQLAQPTWFTDGKRVAVDKHGALSKSPDFADMLMMATHGGTELPPPSVARAGAHHAQRPTFTKKRI